MSSDINLKRLSGHANSQLQQYYQVGTAGVEGLSFWGFTPMGADITLDALTNFDGSDGLPYNPQGTYFEGELYTGSFSGIKPSTGVVKLELNSQ